MLMLLLDSFLPTICTRRGPIFSKNLWHDHDHGPRAIGTTVMHRVSSVVLHRIVFLGADSNKHYPWVSDEPLKTPVAWLSNVNLLRRSSRPCGHWIHILTLWTTEKVLHRTRPFSRLLECPSCRWRCSCNLLVDPNGLHSIYVSIRCSDTLKSDVAVMNWTTRQTSCDPFDFSLLRSLWRFVFKLPAHVLTDSCSLSLLPLGNICRNYVQNTTTTTAFGTHTNNLFVLRFRQKDTIQEQPATSNNVEHNGHGRVRWGSGSLQFFFRQLYFCCLLLLLMFCVATTVAVNE